MKRRFMKWILAALPWIVLSAPLPVQAQPQPLPDDAKDYPRKPIRIIVGFTPGGGPDITARYVAQKLTEAWKQQVIVDNRPGAGGTVGANLVANANPDGYTLLSVSSAHAVAAAVYAKLPYHTTKDLAGITQTASSKYVLVVAPSLGVKSVKELIALAKAKPGQLNFSSAGVGSGTHFSAEQFKAMAGIDVVHVPFKGIPEAVTETMSGRVQYFMAPIANSVNLVKDGKLVGLGVSSLQRDALVPDIPTIAEGGVPGFQSELWFGLLTSAQTPKPIVARLNSELRRMLSGADVKQRWTPIGLEARPTTPAEFDKLVAGEIELFTKIARAANIKAE
jgi:tripartite-type tricarboxylate transporter receptor subunit TctC